MSKAVPLHVGGRRQSSSSSIVWSGCRLSAEAKSSSESQDDYLYSLGGLLAFLVAFGLQVHQFDRFSLAMADSRKLFIVHRFLACIFIGFCSNGGLCVTVSVVGFDGNPVLFPAGRDEIYASLEDLDLVVTVDLAHR